MASFLTPEKILLTLNGLITAIGPYIADWNETHVKNPNWPPHARFHNGQTMTLGALLGLSTIYFTFHGHSPSSTSSPSLRLASLNTALLTSTVYYIAGITGILYPGAKWVDPEFGEGHPQFYAFSVFMGLGVLGWWLERGRVVGKFAGA